ncbi:hypothetical protein EWM62_00210 [Mucilaginibacter terrigena]|uniref:SRPBCC family protein n=1 Tax=Mucilaginibacter terrigena TaxID=2492395 RepID=A0A4Q5LR11_9SPHI|nr:SRPBCC domain-containing protein [Mucilaginibacter terrigena]RYU91902.1 hypothetical protein EWM62_00210 [Mucilaginibacter terrigena]
MNLSFKIKKSRDFIFDYLTDMQKFASVHPVITKIVEQANGGYLVYETLKLGFIPISFTYPVSIVANPDENTIVMQATVMKLTKIEMTFNLAELSDFTAVHEYISFGAPLPVRVILQRVFKKQHRQLFKNIATR